MEPTRENQVDRRTVLRMAGVAGIGLAVSACGDDATTSTPQNSPRRGGTATQMEKEILPTIDPALSLFDDQDMPTLEAVYGPGLVYLDPKTSAVKMGFAKSLTTKDEGHVWTLVLKPGLKFSDGTPFDAEAVAYNIARAANPELGSPMEDSASQLSTKVLDPTTLEITSKPSNAHLPTIMAQNFAFIGSPTAIKSKGKKFGSNPVGPGPFKVKSFKYGISWTFERNPHYAKFAPGQPYLDGITVLQAKSQQNAITAIQTGQGDTWRPHNRETIEQARKAGLTVADLPQPSVGFLTFNTSVAPFDNVLARKAVCLALDPKAVADVWLPGNTTVTNLFTPDSPFYSKKYDFAKQDTKEAQRLFDQLAAEGNPVKFSVTWPQGTVGNVAAYMHGALSRFKNVTMTENAVPHTQFKTDQAAGKFEVTAGSMDSLIPGVFDRFKTNGSSNFGKWSVPAIDEALAKLQGTTDEAEQKKAWDTILQQIKEQFLFVPIWRGSYGYAYRKSDLGGVTLTRYGQVALWGPMYRKK